MPHLFTTGNPLPQQVIITPLFRMYLKIPLPSFLADSDLMHNSAFGLIAINVAFQLGFCVFPLSNYMKSVPCEMREAALVDGTSPWTRFWRLTLPLDRHPQGQFVSNQNLIAAGAMLAAIPPLVVYVLLHKQFVSGLSIGSSKG